MQSPWTMGLNLQVTTLTTGHTVREYNWTSFDLGDGWTTDSSRASMESSATNV
jgi:hypothetical protein